MVEHTQQYTDIRKFLVASDFLEYQLSEDNLGVYDCSVIDKKKTNIAKSLLQAVSHQRVNSEYELDHISGAGFIDIPKNSSQPMEFDTETSVARL